MMDKIIDEIIDSYSGVQDIINYINNNGNMSQLEKNIILNYRETLKRIYQKKLSIKDVLKIYEDKIEDITKEYLSKKNKYGNYVTGISIGIYLKSQYDKNNYTFHIIGGKKSRYNEELIDENTMFDVASVTKLFTLILLLKLEELGYINLDSKIKDINSDFQNLEDFTIRDLMRLHGKLLTNGNVAEAGISVEEANRRLKTLKLISNQKNENTYTDFGAIVIADTISKVMSKALKENKSYSDILNMFILEPLNMNSTMYNPNTNNISGNGRNDLLVNDPKTRNLGGISGASGIFTTSKDIIKLSDSLFSENSIINKKNIERLGEITFPNSKEHIKGNLGLYVKGKLNEGFTPNEFSTNSFSHQGWTGNQVMFDPKKKISISIFSNAIMPIESLSKQGNIITKTNESGKTIYIDSETGEEILKNDKLKGYATAYSEYSNQLFAYVVEMNMILEMYQKYLNYNDLNDIEVTRRILY